ncbi:NADPH-dependent FMN reductase [Saccharopolyspora cebuensis]|uniref:NADPH-dependent FMN reductase n=1 Tax=Saccharopolyspora cebuensis TaxID=418759 RepID=UPI0031E74A03
MQQWTVLGICGSLRQGSYNAALLRLAERTTLETRFIGCDLAGQLPLFNPDMEEDTPNLPAAVREFRACADQADGLVIATPEYAHGPAGVTKNAIDWLIGSGGIMNKPTLLLSASPGQAGGMRAQTPLMPTLTLLGSILVDCVVVSRAAARVAENGEFHDATVAERMKLAMGEFTDALRHSSHKKAT